MIQLGEFGNQKLQSLCDGLGLSANHTKATQDLFKFLAGAWYETQLNSNPAWENDITDDSTPFEFSIALSERATDLRILVEPQRFPVSQGSNWEAGIQLSEKIGLLPGTSLERLRLIQDIFQPKTSVPHLFSIWYAACVNEAGRLDFKIYLNPQIHGDKNAPEILIQALSRLGFRDACDFLLNNLDINRNQNKSIFFSLDLSNEPYSRVKIYFVNPDSNAALLEEQMKSCINYSLGDAKKWLQLFAGKEGSFSSRPIITCYQFNSNEDKARVALHVPVRCYLKNDAEVVDRMMQMLPSKFNYLAEALSQMAGSNLEQSTGLVTYVSLRRERNQEVRVTAYLAPQAYSFVTA